MLNREKSPIASNNKPTICRLVFGFPPATGSGLGGSTLHTIELSRHIDPYCKRQFLIVPRADVDTTELDGSFPFEVYRVRYFKFRWLQWVKTRAFKSLPLAPLVGVSYQFFALKALFELNRKFGIDIIEVNGCGIASVTSLAGKILGKPVLLCQHGTGESKNNLAGKYETAMIKVSALAHCFASLGSREFEKLTCLLGKDKVTGIHYPVNTQKFYPRQKNKQLLKQLGLENKFIIVSIHSLIEVKGVEYAILAFNKFLKATSSPGDSVLLIIGDGGLRKHLEVLVTNLGIGQKVLFLGCVNNDEVPDFLSICDMAIATSTFGNNNCSTREAMACGKPVLAFDCRDTRTVIHHMETGLLAESGNVPALAEEMRILYQKPELRIEIGRKAASFIRVNHNWDNLVNTYLHVAREFL